MRRRFVLNALFPPFKEKEKTFSDLPLLDSLKRDEFVLFFSTGEILIKSISHNNNDNSNNNNKKGDFFGLKRYIGKAEVGKKYLLTKDCKGLYYLQTVKSHVRSIKLVLWFWGVDNVLYNSQP